VSAVKRRFCFRICVYTVVTHCTLPVNAIDNDDMTELWHNRLGHMSEKGMSILSKKNVLSGVHDINLDEVLSLFGRKAD
ncbi:retrovirus-related pol polyprotein from transposon TNT 1-94, partial [Tanacetum coccineum]